MRIRSCRGVYLTALAIDLGLTVVVACGSSTETASNEAGAEGGSDGTMTGDARLDGPTGDAIGDAGHAPAPGSGAIAFCEGEWMIAERCNLTSRACLAAYFDASFDAALEKYLDECATEWSVLESNAYLGALGKCLLGTVSCCAFKGECIDAAITEALDAETCIAEALVAVPPDPEAEKLKADYCKVCPDTASKYRACSGFFSFAEAGILDSGFLDASTLTGTNVGFGSFILAYSDPLVAAIDEGCTGAALAEYDGGDGVTDCYDRFVRCSVSVYNAYVTAFAPMGVDAASIPAACLMDGG